MAEIFIPYRHFGLQHFKNNDVFKSKKTPGLEGLTPKGPNCVFWQCSNFGQVPTNGVFIFFI